jgi:hypothetical protein
MLDLNDVQRDELTAAINALTQADYEYETTHIDAGNNYAHMPAESWSRTDDSELVRQLAGFGINTRGLESDVLSAIALDIFEMQSGSIYMPSGLIVLAGYAVGEIESQVEFSAINVPSIGIVTADHVKHVARDIDAHLGRVSDDSALLYIGTDCVWYAAVTPKAMQEAIDEYIDR